MNNLIIETSSINKLEHEILKTEYIQPNISTNDKTPSWDGELIVYNNKDFKKKNILGKIDIQVKGTFQENLSKEEVSYKVDVTDLRNYKKTGGTIYFVIYISDFDNYRIYYNSLLPYDLYFLLKDIGDQKTKNIKLSSLPINDYQLLMSIFTSFIYDREKQFSTSDTDVSLLNLSKDDIEHIYKFNFSLSNINGSIFDTALKKPTYIYAQPIKYQNISIPMAKVKFDNIMFDNVVQEVYVDGVQYYNNIGIVRDLHGDIIKIGKSIELFTSENKIVFNLNGNLADRIKDIKFILAIKKDSIIRVGNSFEGSFNGWDFDRKMLIKEQKKLEELKKTLDLLEVEDKIDLLNINYNDELNINILIDSILYSKNIKLKVHQELLEIGTIKILNLVILVKCKKLSKSNYCINNMFSGQEVSYYINNGSDRILISIFMTLRKQQFLEISNMNYEYMYKSITSKEYTDEYDEILTNFILEALRAYDEKPNVKLLSFIKDISFWQVNNVKNNKDIAQLNYLQAIKRERKLNADEILLAQNIRLNSNVDIILVGVNIILESWLEAEIKFNNLTVEEQSLFKNYPIYKLWK